MNNKITKRIMRMRLALNEWLIIKRVSWVLINVWYWWKDASLTEVFLINGLIALLHLATKIHSTALGMMVTYRYSDEKPPNPWDDMIFTPPNKDEIN